MKVCLVILDGWGVNKSKYRFDAIDTSACKNMRYLSKNYPSYLINASGQYVGLKTGAMGNSEVGHLTLGSGRVVEQYISIIDRAIESGVIAENLRPILDLDAESLHVLIMISDAGIHSHIDHLFGVLEVLKHKFAKIYIHCITDGRDTAPNVAIKYINRVISYCSENKNCKMVTIGGRYFAMDRDNNKDRIDEYFNTLTRAENVVNGIDDLIKNMYNFSSNDETIKPFRFSVDGVIEPKDKLFFLNFRADRMRQVTEKFIEFGCEVFTMVEYKKDIPARVIFKKHPVHNTLCEVLGTNGVSHSHIAESEKYAHVTYFFNGGKEKEFNMEKRIILDSPKVDSFEKAPKMASGKITRAILKEMDSDVPFIVSNFAAPDMVGHTGNFEATQEAIHKIDKCIGKIYMKCKEKDYVLVVTADHGNAEFMFDESIQMVCKKHTSNQVPLIVCTAKTGEKDGNWGYEDSEYSLRDVAPTILSLFGIEIPKEMTGKSVLK
ncbi:2,3-bisphosphoglycerate-independent phosphoglycerate mutase [Nosema granulosis]|uniref:phosphoglycerate mutase (2,3-diphosphoglycerate-independent) n=1 Tax=Nosema granulosis TaxID=83296 RepID=A0A9P6H3P6_9MICR|nr:2,3-bisphosphoglycerate-independent phosphoglycerate mutase [Nosema granulosis]